MSATGRVSASFSQKLAYIWEPQTIFYVFFFCTREKYGILNKEHLAEGKPKSINRRRLSTKIKMPEGFAINKDA